MPRSMQLQCLAAGVSTGRPADKGRALSAARVLPDMEVDTYIKAALPAGMQRCQGSLQSSLQLQREWAYH